jgi:hypothetical protein
LRSTTASPPSLRGFTPPLTDVALEALREASRERKATSEEIHRYARICRVENVMRPYMEALAA